MHLARTFAPGEVDKTGQKITSWSSSAARRSPGPSSSGPALSLAAFANFLALSSSSSAAVSLCFLLATFFSL